MGRKNSKPKKDLKKYGKKTPKKLLQSDGQHPRNLGAGLEKPKLSR
jgi:hypothetical protein